jgi:hypothetical protein
MFKLENTYIIFIIISIIILFYLINNIFIKLKNTKTQETGKVSTSSERDFRLWNTKINKENFAIEKYDEQYDTTGKILFGLINPFNPNSTDIVTNKTVTFKTPFTNIPIIILSNDDLNGSDSNYYPTGLSTKNITINGFDWDISQNNNPLENKTIKWLAIEPTKTPL